MFDSLTGSFKTIVNKIRFKDDDKALKKALLELKKILLKSDLHHKTAKELLAYIETYSKQHGIGNNTFINALKEGLTAILTTKGNQGFVYSKESLTSILFMGLQGSGKTTTVGKLANYLKLRGKKVLIVACDLQRMSAVEQLKQIASNIEVDIFFDDDAKNPVDVVKKAKEKAKQGLYDVMLVDSAGRLAIDDELMGELKAMQKALNPDEVFYVADALTGQNATKTATAFNDKIGIDGVILSKFDGDTQGGVALSISNQVKVPLRFIGNGEHMSDLEVFLPERIVSRLMGSGDIEGLAEKTSLVIDEKKAKDVAKKIKKGEFNFSDFLEQLEMMKKLGSMKSLIGMIPGMSGMASQLKNMDFENSDELKRIKALIGSMTVKERETPSLLNASRKQRLAKGSGLDEIKVNQILKQFKNASKMAKKLSGKSGKDMQKMLSQMGGDGGGMPPQGFGQGRF